MFILYVKKMHLGFPFPLSWVNITNVSEVPEQDTSQSNYMKTGKRDIDNVDKRNKIQ